MTFQRSKSNILGHQNIIYQKTLDRLLFTQHLIKASVVITRDTARHKSRLVTLDTTNIEQL